MKNAIFSKLPLTIALCCMVMILVSSCEEKTNTLFEIQDNRSIGMAFENTLEFSNEFNVYTYRNFYNGGGVAIGDINNDGWADVYLTAKTKVSDIKLSATYHDFSSDVDSIDYGSEIDVAAAYTINKNYNILVKFSSYSADDHASDTDKLWLQLSANF